MGEVLRMSEFINREEIETLMDREDAKDKLRQQVYRDTEVILEAIVYAAEKNMDSLDKAGVALLDYEPDQFFNLLSGEALEYIEEEVNKRFGE